MTRRRPQVQMDNPLELTCDRTQVNIDGNKSEKGAIYVPTWTGPDWLPAHQVIWLPRMPSDSIF
ncbi:MAG: hypothetical protein U0T81_01215 [Saprospiraceae bacterium]